MRPSSASSSQCSFWSYVRVIAKIVGVILTFHILAVIILSAQSTAAGGQVILFPLALFWPRSNSTLLQLHTPSQSSSNSTWSGKAIIRTSLRNDTETGRGNQTRKQHNETKLMHNSTHTADGTIVLPNPVRLPILPKRSPPPPQRKKQVSDSIKDYLGETRSETAILDSKSKAKLLEQLRARRSEVERLMTKRRAEREGISLEEAEKKQEWRRTEAVEKAVLAVEKPQENIREAFNGGQNGRFMPAPKILSNLFRRDKEDSSWLDKVTDAIVDKLQLRWEDDEEARMEEDEDSEPLMSEALMLPSDTSMQQRPNTKQWPADPCARALKIPKIAMMYLTKGELHHHDTWKLWFEFAEGILPISAVQKSCGDPHQLQIAQRLCKRVEKGNGEDVLANQHLFNVYVHVGLNNQEFKGYSEDSLFFRRDIIERVQVEWGKHSLVSATRNLLKVALQEPLNQKFVLLSEAGIPLYPPTTLYHQLITEEKSRINSCTLPGWERHTHRWTNRMETAQMKAHHWRKSSQWFGLSRSHAELIMADTVINDIFHDNCYPTTEEGRWRDCFSDEHYFATLLAVLGKENETDCKGFIMHVDWSRGGAHPRTYEPREISAARLRLLRMPTENCGYPSAIKTGAAQFVTVSELEESVCTREVLEYAKALGPQCPLFARKFSPETASAITKLVSDCKNRLKIVHGNECHSLLRRYM